MGIFCTLIVYNAVYAQVGALEGHPRWPNGTAAAQ